MVDERKRAGIYSRESKGKKSSIDDQDHENELACEERGWNVVNWYGDKVSASRHSTKERADWPKVIEDVAAGRIDVLVLWEVSRGDRDLETWVPFISTCRKLGVLIHVTSAETTYDSRIPAHWKALIEGGVDAAFETDRISTRSKKGIAGAVRAGKAHGRAPFGLDRIYDQNDRRQFTQRPNADAAIPREIIERIARRDPIIAIERDLNERGVSAPGGGRWTREAIRKAARRAAYAGMREHNGQLHPGNWPAIVDVDVWRAAQAVLNENDRVTNAPGAYRWLLSYFARAGCGSHMQARPGRQGRQDSYMCSVHGCTGVGVRELDEYVTRLTVAWFARRGARALFERSDADAQAARAELAEWNEELRAARAAFARPRGISAEALADKEHALIPLIQEAQKRLAIAETPVAALTLLDAASRGRALIRPAWEALSIAARRSVISTLLEDVRVRSAGTRGLTRWATPDERLRMAVERTTVLWTTGARKVGVPAL